MQLVNKNISFGFQFALGAGLAVVGTLTSTIANAYVGPGAGITMLGALWAVVLAIVFALAGILIWPIRAMLRRRKRTNQEAVGTKEVTPTAEDDV